MGRLDGKVAVITGTGRGQGRVAALRFAEEGAKVVGCDINAENAEETVRLVREAGGTMESLHPVDLAEEESCHRVPEFAAEAYGGIDVLYNNAMEYRAGYPETLSLEDWDFTIRRVLTMHWLVTKHTIPHFRKRGGGAIVWIGSAAGGRHGTALPGNEMLPFAYGAAKAAMVRLSMSIAIELARINVRSNVIMPGPIRTELSDGYFRNPGDPFYEPQLEQLLTDRIGLPLDIANAALFLASDAAGFITGTTLDVDGGMIGSGGQGRPDPEMTLDAIGMGEGITREPYWPTTGLRPS